MRLTQVLISIVIKNDITKHHPPEFWWVVWVSGCGNGVVHNVYDFCEDWNIGSKQC